MYYVFAYYCRVCNARAAHEVVIVYCFIGCYLVSDDVGELFIFRKA